MIPNFNERHPVVAPPAFVTFGISALINLFFMGSLAFADLPLQTESINIAPAAIQEAGVSENLSGQIPLGQMKFRKDTGEEVTLADLAKSGRPHILTFVYYNCNSLCNFLLNGLVEDVQKIDWTLGKQYDWWVVSIDQKEGPELAMPKKEAYLKAFFGLKQSEEWINRPKEFLDKVDSARANFHFLTGSLSNQSASIAELTRIAGFKYKWVPEENQYAHPSVALILTPEGKISRYLYGVRFDPKDLKLALTEAGLGKVGTLVERFLLFCYRYDAVHKGYTIAVWRIVQVLSALMVIGFAIMVFRIIRLERSQLGKAQT